MLEASFRDTGCILQTCSLDLQQENISFESFTTVATVGEINNRLIAFLHSVGPHRVVARTHTQTEREEERQVDRERNTHTHTIKRFTGNSSSFDLRDTICLFAVAVGDDLLQAARRQVGAY